MGNLLTDAVNEISKTGYARQENVEIREDGIRYCTVCGKPLETIIEHPALGIRAYPIMCDCDRIAEQRIRERLADEDHDRKRKTCFGSYAYGYMDARFANDNHKNPDVTRKCMNYCKHFEEICASDQGLLFYGSVGTGKSFMAACIANELIDRGYTAYMTTISAIERQTSGYLQADKSIFMQSLMNYSLLIIDDLGVERQTDYIENLTYEVINSRYVSGKPMIITTNIDIERIKNPVTDYEKRLYDRILDACSYPIKMTGKSQRRANIAGRYASAEELLNEA